MRRTHFLSAILVLALAAGTGCDRGARPSQEDKPAPDFTVSDGMRTIHLAAYRGQPVLLNFWATWCAPCILELPSLLQLHREMPSLAIVAVSVDEDADAYKTFIEHRNITLTTVRDPEEKVAKLFKTEQWPETYAIDRKGIIRRKFVGATDWSSPEIRSFLKSL